MQEGFVIIIIIKLYMSVHWSWRPEDTRGPWSPPPQVPPLACPLCPGLPHLFLHFSYRVSILGLCLLLMLSKFSLFLFPLSSCTIYHSLPPSPSPLPPLCPCSVSPLAHLSLSPRAHCHHAQCPPTRLTPLLSLSYLCPLFFQFPSAPSAHSCLISLYSVVASIQTNGERLLVHLTHWWLPLRWMHPSSLSPSNNNIPWIYAWFS